LNPSLPLLIKLQGLDLRMMEIKDRQRKTPDLIQSAEAPLKEATSRLTQATADVDVLIKERRSNEKDLEAHEAQTEKLRARLTELKTNKEYQAHLFEIEMANKKKGEIEDRILSLMERIEQKQQEVKLLQGRVKEAEGQFADSKRKLEEQSAAFVAELAELDQKHQEIVAALDAGLLERYGKLKAMRKETALAPVQNGTCLGCRLQLPPQLIAEVKRSDELQTCTYCHRILYWEGELPTPAVSSFPSEQDLDLQETT
jgi:predicted  nucleic acid-binding Zn-ribbon protein